MIGDIGETVALAEFTKSGYTVSVPFGQNSPYDLLVDIDGIIYKVQCKTTEKVHDNSVMRFNICRTNGFTGAHISYNEDEIDFFFLYCVENDYKGLLPVGNNANLPKKEFRIRLTEPQNHQMNGINMAETFEFNRQLDKFVNSKHSNIIKFPTNSVKAA